MVAPFDRALSGDFSQSPHHWEVAYGVARGLLSEDEPKLAEVIAQQLDSKGLEGRAKRIVQIRAAVKLGNYPLAAELFKVPTGSPSDDLWLITGDASGEDKGDESSWLFDNPRASMEQDERALVDYVDGARDTYQRLDQPTPLALASIHEMMTEMLRGQRHHSVLTIGLGQTLQDGQTRIEVAQDRTQALVTEVQESLQKVVVAQSAYEQATALVAVELSGLKATITEREWQRTASHFWDLWRECATDREQQDFEDESQRRCGSAVWNKLSDESRRDLTTFLVIEKGIGDAGRFRGFALLVVFERELREALQRAGNVLEDRMTLGAPVDAATGAGGMLPQAMARVARVGLVDLRNALAHGGPYEESEYRATELALLSAGPNGGKSVMNLVVNHKR